MKRRDFLKKSAKGTLAFAMSGLMVDTARAAAGSQQLNGAMIAIRSLLLSPKERRNISYEITADSKTSTQVDGTTLFTWNFNDPVSPGPGVLGSGMVVSEGDSITVTLSNNLDRDINFTVPGVFSGSPATAPGETGTYTFSAPAAGTYLYTDDINGFIGKAMGLFGPLVVMPAGSGDSLYKYGPLFDRQYTMVMSDMDSRLNSAMENGATGYAISEYEPNYYFANGLIYPDTKKYDDTLMTMNVGEDVAVRFVNASVIEYPMHFHGYHVNVIKNDGRLISDFIERDTVLVRPGTTAEVILPVLQAGAFPLHTHYVPGVTVNGVYTNPYGGSLIIMVAS